MTQGFADSEKWLKNDTVINFQGRRLVTGKERINPRRSVVGNTLQILDKHFFRVTDRLAATSVRKS